MSAKLILAGIFFAVPALGFEAVVEEVDGHEEPVVVESVPAPFTPLDENEFSAPAPEHGKKEKKGKGPALFAEGTPLVVTLQTDFAALKNHGGRAKGTLSSGTEKVGVEFTARGKYRRTLCQTLPPFKLVRDKGDVSALFRGTDRDLKFVTHCKDGDAKEQQYVLAEYTLYKILEASGLPGLRARLAQTTYLDPQGKRVAKGTGFFIENLKDYAKRVGLTADSKPARTPKEMEARFHLAQYLLRNTDYGTDFIDKFPAAKGGKLETVTKHNVRVVVNKDKEVLEHIPYDFDLASLTGKEDWAGARKDEAAYNERVATYLLEKHPTVKTEFRELVQRRPAMLQAIADSPVSAEEKKRLATSVGGFLDTLEKHAK